MFKLGNSAGAGHMLSVVETWRKDCGQKRKALSSAQLKLFFFLPEESIAADKAFTRCSFLFTKAVRAKKTHPKISGGDTRLWEEKHTSILNRSPNQLTLLKQF